MLTSSVTQNAPSSDHYWAAHFGKTIIHGWLTNTLTPDHAAQLGRMAGSYARRALAYEQAIANTLARREVVREIAQNEIDGWNVVRAGFGLKAVDRA